MLFQLPFQHPIKAKLKRLPVRAFTCLYFLLFSLLTVQAATVEVEWSTPEKYRDIHAGEGFQNDYQQGVFFNLEKHFRKLAKKLPEENSLKIKVTNLDLAGDVHSGGIDLLRVITDRYPPRIRFEYQYLDINKKVLLNEQVSYRDLSFMAGSTRYRGHYLAHEKKMLDRWFKKHFEKRLAEQTIAHE